MAKKGSGSRKPPRAGTQRPSIKLIRPISWHGYGYGDKPTTFVSHLLTEFGRLDIPSETYSRNTPAGSVLADLLEWLSAHPGPAFAALLDWWRLDIEGLRRRSKGRTPAKPRIEITAEITQRHNLVVRWYPLGWLSAPMNFSRDTTDWSNKIDHRRWKSRPDFIFFEGDEEITWDRRPSNELMYIRGVGNLWPEPREDWGSYVGYNRDVADSIMICAVRASYERLLEQLSYSFDVEAKNAFDFTVREEQRSDVGTPWPFPVRRVTGWTLENARELELRLAYQAEQRREAAEKAALVGLQAAHGCSVEELIQSLERASAQKGTGPTPNAESVNRNAAKFLRSAGCRIDAGDVRRFRDLLQRHRPDVLPQTLHTELQPRPEPPLNVVSFGTASAVNQRELSLPDQSREGRSSERVEAAVAALPRKTIPEHRHNRAAPPGSAALYDIGSNVPPLKVGEPGGKADLFEPPSYAGLRWAPLSEDIKAEFRVNNALDLALRLNELWRDEGRLPLPQGSFPSSPATLRFVVKELRLALAQR